MLDFVEKKKKKLKKEVKVEVVKLEEEKTLSSRTPALAWDQ